jgi:hypothetical protein
MSAYTKLHNPVGTLVPAYGRDYKSKAAVIADFLGGKDFMLQGINGCGYVSISDYVNPDSVSLRYSKLTKQTIVKVEGVA